VPEQDNWGEVKFSTDETYGDIKLRLYYSSTTACDTIIPDDHLFGNSSGFDSSVDILYISTTTYDRICLQATLINDGGTPYLNDWSVTWGVAAVVSVTVEPTTFDYGTMPFDSSKESFNTHGILKGKNIKATVGSAVTDLYIKGATTTDWALGATADASTYVHKFATSTDETTQPTGYTALTLDYADNILATEVESEGSVWFGLEIHSPLSGATTTQSVPVIIRATEAGS